MNCQICGKPSGYLPLCKSCFKLKDEDKVMKCPVCDKWRKTDEVCPSCGNKPIRIVENTTQQESNVDPITCLICGENSNGKHFCRSCYFKYKDRSIDIRITNCNSTQLLDEFGTRTKKAKDGRYVRSLSEKIIILFRQLHKGSLWKDNTICKWKRGRKAIAPRLLPYRLWLIYRI